MTDETPVDVSTLRRLRACRCGTLEYEPCQGTDGRGCDVPPRPQRLERGVLLATARWWTCLVGTTWSLVDTFTQPDRAERRARNTMRRGGVVRWATESEVAAWDELQRIQTELAGARTSEAKLDVLATDTLGAVQLELV